MSRKSYKKCSVFKIRASMKHTELEAKTLYKDEVRSIDTYSKTSLIHTPKIWATLLSGLLNQAKLIK